MTDPDQHAEGARAERWLIDHNSRAWEDAIDESRRERRMAWREKMRAWFAGTGPRPDTIVGGPDAR